MSHLNTAFQRGIRDGELAFSKAAKDWLSESKSNADATPTRAHNSATQLNSTTGTETALSVQRLRDALKKTSSAAGEVAKEAPKALERLQNALLRGAVSATPGAAIGAMAAGPGERGHGALTGGLAAGTLGVAGGPALARLAAKLPGAAGAAPGISALGTAALAGGLAGGGYHRATHKEPSAIDKLRKKLSAAEDPSGGAPSLGDPNYWQGGTQQGAPQPQDAEEAIGLLPGGTFQGANVRITPDGQKTTNVKVTPDALMDPNAIQTFFQTEPGVKVEIASPDQVPAVPVQGGGAAGGAPQPGMDPNAGAVPQDPNAGMLG